MIEALDYPPLAHIPEYATEHAKLQRFRDELVKAKDRLTKMEADWWQSQQVKKDESGVAVIARAESLLIGTTTPSLQETTRQTVVLIASLRDAIESQQTVVNRIASDLSRKAAQRYSVEHKKRSKRLLDALLELHAANVAEISLRDSIDALGYSQQLPCTRFEFPNGNTVNPHDPDGGYAPAWFKDVVDYLRTAEERQALQDQQEREAQNHARRRTLAKLAA